MVHLPGILQVLGAIGCERMFKAAWANLERNGVLDQKKAPGLFRPRDTSGSRAVFAG